MPSWQHIVAEVIPLLIAMVVGQWLAHRDSEKKASERESKRDEKLLFVLTEHVPHTHQEKHGPLQAENISFPKVRVNGK